MTVYLKTTKNDNYINMDNVTVLQISSDGQMYRLEAVSPPFTFTLAESDNRPTIERMLNQLFIIMSKIMTEVRVFRNDGTNWLQI